MSPAEALAAIRGYAGANRIEFTAHAVTRMGMRHASYADVREALMTAKSCRQQPDGAWRAEGGHDLDGDELTVVVVIEDGLVVVTFF